MNNDQHSPNSSSNRSHTKASGKQISVNPQQPRSQVGTAPGSDATMLIENIAASMLSESALAAKGSHWGEM